MACGSISARLQHSSTPSLASYLGQETQRSPGQQVPRGALQRAMAGACLSRTISWRNFLGKFSSSFHANCSLQPQLSTTKSEIRKFAMEAEQSLGLQAGRRRSDVSTYALANERSNVGTEKEGGERFHWPHSQRPRICILGGGFGGLYTALRLESLIWKPQQRPQIVVVDQSDRFVFKPLLYELLSREVEEWEVAPRFTDLLAGTEAQFVRGTVTQVFPLHGMGPDNEPRVVLDSGMELAYDWLVLALGADVDKEIVPGAKENAQAFCTLEDALETERKLVALERLAMQRGRVEGVHAEREGVGGEERGLRVTVVGGGYSGVELAATVAQRLGTKGRVQIIDPSAEIIKFAPNGNRESAQKVLAARNVDLLLGTRVESLASVEDAQSCGPAAHSSHAAPTGASLRVMNMSSNAAQTIYSDLVLWTVGNRPNVPPTAVGEGEGGRGREWPHEGLKCSFPKSGRGQAETESTLRVKGFNNVFALGDSACFVDASGKLLGSTAQVAFQQSDYVAWNLWASINSRPLLPFRYQHLGDMMTLGPSEGAVAVGPAPGLALRGPLAHLVRKAAYLYRQPTTEHMAKVGASWLAKAAVDSLVALQDAVALSLRPQR